MKRSPILLVLLLACLTLSPFASTSAQSLAPAFPPQEYHERQDRNSVSELFERIDAGEATLDYESGSGYLLSLLKALDIPVSSQCLVFSKTSLQAARISPKNPRAIYFNDDVYIGWVQGSSLLEIATADPELGAAFYTMRMQPGRASIRRENNTCLACHEIPMTQDVPGHAVRSVLTRSSGNINSLERSFVTDHKSPFEERWGGWYVTGQAGDHQHMGNAFLEGDDLVPFGDRIRTDLKDDFDCSRWPSPFSDVVALMVMEHQTQMQNVLTRANLSMRQFSPSVTAESSPEFARTLEDESLRIVEYLLFAGEVKPNGPIQCSNQFTVDFEARGPFTADGRSLRMFDLEQRLFRYPCSYIIYSRLFDALDERLKTAVYSRLNNGLQGSDDSHLFAHLSTDTRRQILEILRETKPGFPK